MAGPRDDLLLDALRAALGAPGLAWARPPARIADGAESTILAVSLSGAPPHARGPAVARLLAVDDPEQIAREAAMQAALADAGFPAPRPIAHGAGDGAALRPFLLMERLPGRVLFAWSPVLGVLWIALAWIGWGALGWVLVAGFYGVAVRVQQRLHGLPRERVERAMTARGIDPQVFSTSAAVERLAAKIEDLGLGELRAGAAWLVGRLPGETDIVVCHGDYWPGNVMVSGRGVGGVIDWANAALAPREYDLAWCRVQHASDPPGVERLREPWRGRIGAAIHPLLWLATAAHLGAYGIFRRLDRRLLDYYTALHCLRILVWSHERERAEPGAPTPWNSARARAAVARRFARITGVELEGAGRGAGS